MLALSGQPPAGIVPAEQFQRLDAAPVVNNRSQVAFLAAPAAQDGRPYSGATSVWLTDGIESRLLANATPHDSGGTLQPLFDSFSDLVLNDAGAVLFEAALVSDAHIAHRPHGIWLSHPERLAPIAASGDAAPGFEGPAFHSFFGQPALAADGSTSFFGAVRSGDGSLEGGLWVGTGTESTVGLVAGSSGGAMSGEGGTHPSFDLQTFGSPFSDRPVVAEGGRTAFQAFVEGPPDQRFSLWTYRGDEGLRKLVQSGDAAPGSESATFVSFPEPPQINDRGDVTFLAVASSAAPSHDETHGANGYVDLGELSLGIWSTRSGALEPVVYEGDHAEGLGEGAYFADFGRTLMNGRGDVALLAVVDGPAPNDSELVGIWSDGMADAGELRPVAHSGLQAPGTPPGVVFHTFLEPALNNAGQAAFLATVAGPGVSDGDGNVLGLWGQDRSGRVHLVARAGDLIEVAVDDRRTIEAIDFASGSGGQDGRPRGLNDAGQVAFRVRFTDGTSAVVLSNRLAVPEPATEWLVFVFVFAALVVFHKRK